MKAWETWWGGCTVYVAAETRAKARYITASMAAGAHGIETEGVLYEVQVARAPQHDSKAALKGEPGSLHPLDQWKTTQVKEQKHAKDDG